MLEGGGAVGGAVRVTVKPGNRVVEVSVDGEITVAELVERLGFSRESVVVVIDGKVAPEWARVKPGSEVLVLRAVSGG